MAPERTLQTKGRGDGVAKDSRKKLFFSRRWRFPETGILINCHLLAGTYNGKLNAVLALAHAVIAVDGRAPAPNNSLTNGGFLAGKRKDQAL